MDMIAASWAQKWTRGSLDGVVMVAGMDVALTAHWEGFIRRMIESGRYNDASEVVRAALRRLEEVEGESFPAGSLKHLYTRAENDGEAKLARKLRTHTPAEA
jgi:putative addiction module CopG family antidote